MTQIIIEFEPDDRTGDMELSETEASLLRSQNKAFTCPVCSKENRQVIHPMPWMDREEILAELGRGGEGDGTGENQS